MEWESLDMKPTNDDSAILRDLSPMDLFQQPLKITISDIKAKHLRDTGSAKDPQDPSVSLKIGNSSFVTKRFYLSYFHYFCIVNKYYSRQKDAGTNASYKERFTVEIDPGKINATNVLEVESFKTMN